VVISGALVLGALGSPTLVGASVKNDSGLYVPKPDQAARVQIGALRDAGDAADAALIESMVETPQAVWFTKGTPAQVEQSVRTTLNHAKKSTAVLVAYNIPFRDCAQFSAGGATTPDEYRAWIDGFAAGIGDAPTIVILEPDSLGIIPWYNPFADRDTWVANPNLEWCQPGEADPATAAADRFAMLNYAVDRLKEHPNTRVYLDGTHSGWLGAGDAADRLIQAGVGRADGFYLNVSNYRLDAHLEKYGTWISKCIAFASNPQSWGLGHTEWCASQYSPANPNDFSTWSLSDEWYANNVESQTWWYDASLLKHFVVDTSRNGHGPWDPTTSAFADEYAGKDAQDWCNPPGRGLGLRPTLDTGHALIDAYLWIKIPGQSDGQCTRSLGPVGTVDPEWGLVDPAAGQWFPEQALQLAQLANPPLVP
jgi:endoglucanase